MTILWCGGENVDFAGLTNGNDGYKDDAFARVALAGTDYAVLPTSIINGWLSYNHYIWVSHYSGKACGFFNKLTGGWIGLYVNSVADVSYFTLAKYDGTTLTTLGNSGSVYLSGGHNRISIFLNYAVAGECKIYLNGTEAISFTADVTISGTTNFDAIKFFEIGYHWYSEFIVADEDTRLMRLKTLAPSAAGDTNAWTGAYTDIDETTLSDSDKIYSATDGDDFQCNLTGMPTGTWSVKAVKVAARCVDGSGSTGIGVGIKSGGTVASGDTQEASGYWQTKERLMQVNPVTGVAFTPAEIEALQVNLRAKAL